MEPEALALGDVGQLAGQVDRAGVRRADHGRDRERGQPGSPIRGDRFRDRIPPQPEPLVGRDEMERLRWEAELVERPGDREVGLVRRVDPGPLEPATAGRSVEAQDPGEVDVAGHGHAHEVGHDPARGEHAEALRAVADEVAQPAPDLLLDEGAARPGMPHVHPLVGELGQQLADDRGDERRGREVTERPGMPGVELMRGEADPELLEQLDHRGGSQRRRAGSLGARAVVGPAQRGSSPPARPSSGGGPPRRGSRDPPPRPSRRAARAPRGRSRHRRRRSGRARGASRSARRPTDGDRIWAARGHGSGRRPRVRERDAPPGAGRRARQASRPRPAPGAMAVGPVSLRLVTQTDPTPEPTPARRRSRRPRPRTDRRARSTRAR